MALQGEALLAAGETCQWPFRLRMPKSTLPSFTAQKSFVIWWVRGTIDRRVRSDLVVECQVQVYTAPRQM